MSKLSQVIGLIKNNRIKLLKLCNYKIGDEGVIALAGALKDNHTIIRLNLCDNKIGNEGAIVLVEALKDNHTITHLDLGYNKIGDEGVIVLAEILKHNYTIIQLHVNHIKIGDEGVIALAEVLKHNHTITELNLSYNEISPKGARVLAVALKTNGSVIRLGFYDDAISDKKFKEEIKKIIERNTKYWTEYCKDTIEFLEKNFAPKPTENSSLYEVLPNLFYNLKPIAINKFEPTYNIKSFKIFQHVNEHILKLGMAEAHLLSINKAKSYIHDNWFELSGVCQNFEPKLINEFSLLTSLPKEIVNHIVSFLGHNSLWQIQHDHALASNEVTTTGETNLSLNNI